MSDDMQDSPRACAAFAGGYWCVRNAGHSGEHVAEAVGAAAVPAQTEKHSNEDAIPEAAVEAAARQIWGKGWDEQYENLTAVRGKITRDALAAALPHLLTELRMTEGDLAVASRVATERADEIAELRAEADRLDRVLDGLVDHKLQLDEMRAFAAWLIAMDDPEDVIGRSVIETALRAAMPKIEQRLYEQWTAEMRDKLCSDPCPTRPNIRCDLPAGHDGAAHRRSGSGIAWWAEPVVAAASVTTPEDQDGNR